ncbi:hypothetical protein [Nannocystis punicea]|uniref:Uncharacterized protein n=1 Tax=Nannocystis punicea TaxID=2995304 RepID=A0ABY7H6Q6_9BACT|nr:hypothetical protein [Nannocystis poenicansa]WAS94964.1 hypothetical protein O0S08_02280 [Nannocystis poenicansa]
MRRWLLGGSAALLAACLPVEPEYLITAPQFRGVRLEVVEPGGYASLLNVPAGRRRATFLPLDTIELTAFFAAPPGVDVQPPVWLVCGFDCVMKGPLAAIAGDVPDCPTPLPLGVPELCRLDEGQQIRVGLGGAFTVARPDLQLLIIASRDAAVTPAACLERLSRPPHTALEACILVQWELLLGPQWAPLPFGPDASHIPPEILAQDVDINPDVVEFRVTRQRGAERSEHLVAPGSSVGVRRRDRITVEPIFTEGSAQTYWLTSGDEEGKPWSGEPVSREERLQIRGWFDAPVLDFGWVSYTDWDDPTIEFVVPDDVVPTRLFLDVTDNRSGRASAELLFVADDAP